MGCVRETPQIKIKNEKKKRKKRMCKRNSPDKNEASTGCVREIPQIIKEKKKKKRKKANTGCVKETPQIKMKATCDV